MPSNVLWQKFLTQTEKEGFRIFERKQFESMDRQRSSIIAADPARFLLLYASSEWTNKDKEVVRMAVVTGFMNASGYTGLAWRQLFDGCPLDTAKRPFVCFEYYLPSTYDFSWLRDPERLAAFCKWQPIDDAATVSEPTRDSAAEWKAFRSRAPHWVKSFIG